MGNRAQVSRAERCTGADLSKGGPHTVKQPAQQLPHCTDLSPGLAASPSTLGIKDTHPWIKAMEGAHLQHSSPATASLVPQQEK